MKKWSVYELVNLMGTVEYVGRTYRPKHRLYQHTKVEPKEGYTGFGGFYGRQDILMNIVAEFDELKDANLYEGELKLSYGIEWVERDKCVKNGRNTGLQYGRKNGIEFNSEPVLVYKVDGTFVGEYYSAIECSRQLNLHQASVARVVLGKQKTTEGYIIKKK